VAPAARRPLGSRPSGKQPRGPIPDQPACERLAEGETFVLALRHFQCGLAARNSWSALRFASRIASCSVCPVPKTQRATVLIEHGCRKRGSSHRGLVALRSHIGLGSSPPFDRADPDVGRAVAFEILVADGLGFPLFLPKVTSPSGVITSQPPPSSSCWASHTHLPAERTVSFRPAICSSFASTPAGAFSPGWLRGSLPWCCLKDNPLPATRFSVARAASRSAPARSGFENDLPFGMIR